MYTLLHSNIQCTCIKKNTIADKELIVIYACHLHQVVLKISFYRPNGMSAKIFYFPHPVVVVWIRTAARMSTLGILFSVFA